MMMERGWMMRGRMDEGIDEGWMDEGIDEEGWM